MLNPAMVDRCNCIRTGYQEVANALKSLTGLQNLDLRCHFFLGPPSVHTHLHPAETGRITHTLRELTRWNELGSDGCRVICDALLGLSKLEHLDLRW